MGCRQLWDTIGQALLGQASVKHIVFLATWLVSLGTVLFLAGWLGTAADTGKRRSQGKLRKLLEPALSRGFTGQVFRRKSLFCLCKRPGVSTVARHTASQSQEPSEAAAFLSQALGKGVSSLLPLGSKCKGGFNITGVGTFLPCP